MPALKVRQIRLEVIDRLRVATKQPRRVVPPVQSSALSALDVLGYLFLGLASSAWAIICLGFAAKETV